MTKRKIPLDLNKAQLRIIQQWRTEWAEILNDPDESIGGADCVDWTIQVIANLSKLSDK